MIKNTKNSYGLVAKTFHWIMALIIIGLVLVGFTMGNFTGPLKGTLYGTHKALGVIALVLVACRLLWRLANTTPTLPQDIPTWQRLGAGANILLLYGLMFVMPLSGLFMSLFGGHEVSIFGFYTLPALTAGPTPEGKLAWEVHTTVCWVLVASVSLHLLAGLYHHFGRRDNVLMRMLWK